MSNIVEFTKCLSDAVLQGLLLEAKQNSTIHSYASYMEKSHAAGKPLIEAIQRRKNELGLTTQQAAVAVTLSQPYFQALLSGTRPIQGISEDIKRKLADWLGVSLVDVYIMAEQLQPNDFLIEQDLGDRLRLTVKKIHADNTVRQFAPTTEEWDSLSDRTKFFICMIYERMHEVEILRKVQRKEWVVEKPTEK